MDLSNQKVLVTGGAGWGVGGGVCEVLAELGAQLIINDIDVDKAQKAAARYPNAVAIAADISKDAEVDAMFAQIAKEVGTLTALVNNAGVGLSKKAHLADPQDFDRLYSIDIRAVWYVSRAFVNQLLGTGMKGSIVNISSVHAHATQPGFAIYCSAKNAVEGLTKGMAFELGKDGIRVNALGPGLVHAEQNYELIKNWNEDPDQYLSDFVNYQQAIPEPILPKHCGNVAAFLISEMSASVTGQSLYVDAGTTIMLHNRDFIEGK